VFRGTYVFQNPDAEQRNMRVKFPFPAEHAIYDDFTILVNGVAARRGGDLTKEVETIAVVAPNATITLDVTYRSRGLDDWRYSDAGCDSRRPPNADQDPDRSSDRTVIRTIWPS